MLGILAVRSKGKALMRLNGQRLRELRKLCRLSQEKLGEKVGVSASAIGMYEQGRREPAHETLCRLAAVFGVSVDYLLGNPAGASSLTVEELAGEIMKNLSAQKALMFHGGQLEEEDLAKLGDAIYRAVEYALARQNDAPDPHR
jgi:transcriptional regulator with XRE-family HTH domain